MIEQIKRDLAELFVIFLFCATMGLTLGVLDLLITFAIRSYRGW